MMPSEFKASHGWKRWCCTMSSHLDCCLCSNNILSLLYIYPNGWQSDYCSTTMDWSVEAILQYFLTNKSEISDSGNFKKKTYAAAAETTQGTRTWEQVRTKWQGVSQFFYLSNWLLITDHDNFSWKQCIMPSKQIRTNWVFIGMIQRMKDRLGKVQTSVQKMKKRCGSQWLIWRCVACKKKKRANKLISQRFLFLCQKTILWNPSATRDGNGCLTWRKFYL